MQILIKYLLKEDARLFFVVQIIMREISPFELNENFFKAIGKDWTLVTAGDKNKYNTMTASWGSVGIMWNKPVAFTFIRPQRYTYEFMENSDYYTLSVYGEEYRSALTLCGTRSGRDIDKAKETGLTPVFDEKAPYFAQAKMVLVCRKMYAQNLNEDSVIDESIKSNYADNDYHKMYVSEIVKVLVND